MRKVIVGTVILLLLALTFPARQGYCEAQTPEQLVRDFYAWYFEGKEWPLDAWKKDEIYKYVSKETVKSILNRNSSLDISYFAKANTYGSAGWGNPKVVVDKAVPMLDDVFIVPVTFKLSYEDYRKDYYVVVYVGKEDGLLRIIKVSDIYPYS